MKKNIIISVGGSLIVPTADKVNYNFLKKIITLISENNDKYRFILVTGGGKIARNYIDSAKKVRKISNNEADNLGIAATRLNANLLRILLKDKAYKEIIIDPSDNVKTNKILVAGGYKPGRSTDAMAIELAIKYKAKQVINLSNIDYVYDKDPSKYTDTKKIKNLTWQEFLNLFGTKWIPGKNTPFDPLAAYMAQKNKIEVSIINGNKLNNLSKYLNNFKYKGTEIR